MFVGAKKPFLVIGLFVVALVLPLSIFFLQQQQNVKSRAEQRDLIGNGISNNGDVNGNVIGNGNSVQGNVIGDLIGDGNSINGSVTGCIKGINNSVNGNVGRDIFGTGNNVTGTTGSGPCLSTASNLSPTSVLTPTQGPTPTAGPTPTTGPTPTPSPTSTVPTPTAAPLVCKDVPADISIIIDKSGSMNDKTSVGAGTTKIAGAKTAASNFVDILAQNSQNAADLVTFSTTASLDSALTNNFSSLKSKINAISASGWTCIECGIKKANADIQSKGRSGFKKVIVLLTDGKANYIEGSSKEQSQSTAEQKALEAAAAGHTASGTIFFTIGLGNDVNADFLEKIAKTYGGKYYFPPSPEALNAIYQEISHIIAQGSISGTVFNDGNQNATQDSGEQKLPNWQVEATSGSTKLSATTDDRGNYFISQLCDGTFTVKPVLKTGWIQTLPTGGNGYSVTITNGSAITGKDFGVALFTPTNTPLPTSTPLPSSTKLSLELFLHNIGNSGDNANPAFSLSNKNPLHPVRDVVVSLFDANGNSVATTSGEVTYSNTNGSFKTVLALDPSITGSFKVKVRTREHLTKLLPGILVVNPGETYTLPVAHYVATDNNNDNKLNILDYNMLLDCYSDKLSAPACSTTQKKLDTDANDDSNVNQYDYNLFVREISVQEGD